MNKDAYMRRDLKYHFRDKDLDLHCSKQATKVKRLRNGCKRRLEAIDPEDRELIVREAELESILNTQESKTCASPSALPVR